MKLLKCAIFVIFVMTLGNLSLTVYMHSKAKEHAEHEIIIPPNPMIEQTLMNGMVRDTQIMQGILMTHHKLGIHQPGTQDMCPTCEQIKNNPNVITVSSD